MLSTAPRSQGREELGSGAPSLDVLPCSMCIRPVPILKLVAPGQCLSRNEIKTGLGSDW